MSQKNKKRLVFIATIIVVAILTYLPFRFGFVSGGDIFYPIYPGNFLKSFFSSWVSKEGLGSANSNIADIFLYIGFYVLYFFKLSPKYAQYVWYLMLNLLSAGFMFILIREVIDLLKLKKNSIVVSFTILLYLFNPIVFVSYQQSSFLLSLSYLPLLIFISIKLFVRRDFKYVFLFPILSLFFYYVSVNPPLLVASLVIPVLIFLVSLCIYKGKRIKIIYNAILTMIFYLITNLFWILPFIRFTDTGGMQADTTLNWLKWTSINSTYSNIFKLIGSWTFSNSAFGSDTSSIAQVYSGNLYMIISSLFIFLILFFAVYYFKNQEKKIKQVVIALLLTFLLLVILSAGPNDPFGLIFSILYLKLSPFWLFREPWVKFTPALMLVLALIFLIISSFRLRTKHKKYMLYLVCLSAGTFLLLNVYVMAKGLVFPRERGNFPGFYVEIPDYFYQKIDDECRESEDLGRTLYMPPNPFYQVHMLWPNDGYYGYDPLLTNVCNDIVNSAPGGGYVKSLKSSTVIGLFYDNFYKEGFNPKKYMSIMSIDKILLRYDLDWTHLGTLESNSLNNPMKIKKEFVDRLGFSNVKSFGKLSNYQRDDDQFYRYLLEKNPGLENQNAMEIYTLKEEDRLNKIYSPKDIIVSEKPLSYLADIISSDDFEIDDAVVLKSIQNNTSFDYDNNDFGQQLIDFKKINQTKYRIKISNVKGVVPLVFSETYNIGWKLYSENLSGSGVLEDYSHGSRVNQSLRGGKYNSNWFQSPSVSEEDHYVSNGYSNLWLVDVDKMCNEQICKINEDGSYDIEFSLEFEYQKLFTLSFAGSILGLIICISGSTYIIYRSRRKHKRV